MTDAPRSQQRLIAALVVAVQEHKPSPEELRYAFKMVREKTGIRRPVRPARLPKFYTPAEVYALIEGAARVSPKHRLFVECLIQTGLRISEFQQLDVRDLYADQYQLLVRHGKSGRERYVPLSGGLCRRLERLPEYGQAVQCQGGKPDHPSLNVRGFRTCHGCRVFLRKRRGVSARQEQ